MKRIGILIVVLISAVSALAANTGDNKESNFARTDDFKLVYAQNEGAFSCKLKATYTSVDDKYKVYFILDTDQKQILELDGPLNYQYFTDKFQEGLKTVNSNVKPLSNRSIQEVFTWVYTLTVADGDDDVTSGVLILKPWLMVFSANGKIITEAKKREKIVDSLTESYNAVQALADQTMQDLTRQLTEKINQGKSDTDKDLKAKNNAIASWIISKYQVDQKKIEIKEMQDDSIKKMKLIDTLSEGNDSLKKIKDSIRQAVQKTYDTQLSANRQLLDAFEQQVKTDDQTKKIATDIYNKEIERSRSRKLSGNTILDTVLSNLKMGIYSSIEDVVHDSVKIKDAAINALLLQYVNQKKELRKLGAIQLNSYAIHSIRRISIVFERGYIERIQAWIGNGHGGEDIYENIYGIGVTSINNLRQMDNVRLFIRRSSGNDFIFLSDLFGNYDNFLASFTRDYSPADTALNNLVPSEQPRITLKKERIINLFDAKIYTDFAGLQQDAPNGLIQTEVSRRFNIHSYRGQIANTRQDWGSLNYLYAYGTISKIEDKDRRLPLRNQNVVVNNHLASPSYTTNLDLRRYENASAGIFANLLLYDNPDFKITFYLDAGIRYGHIPVADSIRNIRNGIVDSPSMAINGDAHTITYEPIRLTLEVFSERRVGLTLNYQYNITHLYSNRFKQVASYEKSDLTAFPIDRLARQMHLFEMTLRVETSRQNNGKLFFRTRFFWQRGDVNTFFPQLQLGYAYNLVFRK